MGVLSAIVLPLFTMGSAGKVKSSRWCWVNFLCRGVQLIWVRIRQGPTALAVGAGGGFGHFSLDYHFSFLSPCLSGGRPNID